MTNDRIRLAVTLACLAVATAALTLFAGVGGAIVGLLVAGVWLVATPPLAFAVAHLLVILVVPETGGVLASVESAPLFVAELALLCALAVPSTDSPTWRAAVTVTLGGGLVLLGVTGLAVQTLDPQWATAALVVVVAAATLYTVHRVERVTLGLVTEDLE